MARQTTQPLPSVLWLYGSQLFLVDEKLNELKERILVGPAAQDFDYTVFVWRDTQPARILDEAQLAPMVAKRRLIVVKDVPVKAERKKEGGADDKDDNSSLAGGFQTLLPLVTSPSPTSTTVFISELKPPATLKFIKE